LDSWKKNVLSGDITRRGFLGSWPIPRLVVFCWFVGPVLEIAVGGFGPQIKYLTVSTLGATKNHLARLPPRDRSSSSHWPRMTVWTRDQQRVGLGHGKISYQNPWAPVVNETSPSGRCSGRRPVLLPAIQFAFRTDSRGPCTRGGFSSVIGTRCRDDDLMTLPDSERGSSNGGFESRLFRRIGIQSLAIVLDVPLTGTPIIL
jgi:hypothetical protein